MNVYRVEGMNRYAKSFTTFETLYGLLLTSYDFNSDGCFWSSFKYFLIVQLKTLLYSKPFRTKRPRNILRSHTYFDSFLNFKART
jgi:hypothetical protein